MARRILTAVIAIPIAVAIIMLDNIYVLVAVMSLLSVVAAYEVLLATKYLQNKTLTVVSLAFVAMMPFLLTIDFFRSKTVVIIGIFMISLFVILLVMHETVRLEQISLVAFISTMLPLSLSCIPMSRIRFEENGMFCVFYILLIPWISDAGAYFVGTFFGKHKMAPKISPKKSWEGFVGGVAVAAVVGYFSGVVYEYIAHNALGMTDLSVDCVNLTIMAVICAVLGVFGDLSASNIKRQCSVKDFGTIVPGHGGVLDRFDSILFVAPFVYHAFSMFSPFGITG